MRAADAVVHRTEEIRILSCVTFEYCLKTWLFSKNDLCVTSHPVSIIAIIKNNSIHSNFYSGWPNIGAF